MSLASEMEKLAEEEMTAVPELKNIMVRVNGYAERHDVYEVLSYYEKVISYPGMRWMVERAVSEYVPIICSKRNISAMSDLCTLYVNSDYWNHLYIYVTQEMQNIMGRN